MANRILTQNERDEIFAPLIDAVRAQLKVASGGDESLLWALRRKLAKELVYDERDTPMARKKLKKEKRDEQSNRCPECKDPLPDIGAVLDRLEAMKGYNKENTRLLCPDCDRKIQAQRGYK